MRVHYLQHVPFENLGSLEPYLVQEGHTLSSSHLYLNDPLPPPDDFDCLIVMGGPMGVNDDRLHPWLPREKKFIEKSIERGKIVLGICLGAQLIAHVLGAAVYKNSHREIGWFPLVVHEQVNDTFLKGVFPQGLEVFHWHGDTFDIPDSGRPIASSAATRNQGFIVDDRILALQFHLETTPRSARALVEHCGYELDHSEFVQTSEEMLSNEGRFAVINHIMILVIQALRIEP